MERGKDLPPITLDNTSVSYLVTLIPVLVSMTSKDKMPQEPRFENETDKPAWWPPDVQWRNPKCYMHDHLEKEERLLILRKLVHSCYSYHGVADLLCRLDEMPSPEAEDGLEVIELAEEDKESGSAIDHDGPVFVCCFCLEQFSSHEEVNHHQSICKNSLKQPQSAVSPTSGTVTSKGHRPSPKPAGAKCFLEQEEPSDSKATEASDFLDAILCSRVPSAPVVSSTKAVFTSVSKAQPVAASQPLATGKPVRKPAPASSNPYPFVPTLKTRSQKKLDQIMLKHSMKKKMLKECKEMKAVPKAGAWWRSGKRRVASPTQHPSSCTSQTTFCAALGLVTAKDVKHCDKEQQEVDLDCQIVLVEGPLGSVPGTAESNCSQLPAMSPRSSKSLMSQLCRDSEETGRRKPSFRFLEDEWADKEALEEGRDPQQMSLLSIEFSSPLGIRIKKYMAGEGQLNIVKDPEVFCKTENIDDSYSKLRVRANDYRVTFRRKRRASRFVHTYKFNTKDRLEFKRILQTGLNARSRKIHRQLTKCIVSLKRMSKSEIKEWTEGRKIIISERIVVDDDICITQVDIPEAQMMKALSQKRNGSEYKPGPKCFAGLERRHTSNTPLNRPAMIPYGAPSPPHVPNIFRSRNSHAPSPPRLGSFSRPLTASHFKGYVPQSNPSQRQIAEMSRPQQNRAGFPGQVHLSQHITLAPSIHERRRDMQQGVASISSGSSNSNCQVFTGHNSPNRRKQQLTHVRRDDVDSPLVRQSSQFSTNPFTRRPTTSVSGSHNGQHVENSSFSSSSFSPASMLGRKLSNFDHFSIRNGKLASTSSPSSQRQHLTPAQLVGRHSPLFKQQLHSGHRSRPLPDWGSPGHPALKNGPPNQSPSLLSAPAPTSSRSVSVIQGPQNRAQQHQRRPTPSHQVSKPGLKQHKQQAKPSVSTDEDVMEVICIDDD
ncbi:nuclear respiratory factor 1 [Elysia marginata]|uniref:Nuclear respiratory factor 1 n=1 Tax=Elysia marginata TaxID=1093978 RepID=A0AAV4EQ70_9GAST|nr:nuclear respiratory factor 1 [Elysia marginata]